MLREWGWTAGHSVQSSVIQCHLADLNRRRYNVQLAVVIIVLGWAGVRGVHGVRLTIPRFRDEGDWGYGHENGHNQLTSDRRAKSTAQKLFGVTYYLRWPLSASRSGRIEGGAKAHRIRGALSISQLLHTLRSRFRPRLTL